MITFRHRCGHPALAHNIASPHCQTCALLSVSSHAVMDTRDIEQAWRRFNDREFLRRTWADDSGAANEYRGLDDHVVPAHRTACHHDNRVHIPALKIAERRPGTRPDLTGWIDFRILSVHRALSTDGFVPGESYTAWWQRQEIP